jgi:hypothetical protein
VSESAVSAKRVWFMFGAKPAQSETAVRAAAKRRPPGRGTVEKKTRSYSLESTISPRGVGLVFAVGSVPRYQREESAANRRLLYAL